MLILAAILVVAFGIDMLLGDPPYSWHPVRLMGRLATVMENLLRKLGLDGQLGGWILALAHPASVVLIYWMSRSLVGSVHPSAVYLIDVFAFYSCFAFRDLFQHVTPVAEALEAEDLLAARRRAQRIVGRDTSVLDTAGVSRAAVESVAENLGDGALGPLAWFLLSGGLTAGWFGLPSSDSVFYALAGALIYRAINTLDSMVGHKNERYLHFGRASARLDDFLSFLPARWSVVKLGVAAALLRLDVGGGIRIWSRDRRRHSSPNAGHPESFVAGALGVRLGGPTEYPYGQVDRAWLGDGRAELTSADVRRGCRLVRWAGVLAVGSAVAGLVTFDNLETVLR